ncbi:MaoC family dehydratase [Pelagibacterium limicola]|uniref:MaoC family dehydratase n=1 Tax=Pelagibacterium limicola TaxID=2791022 RepID=UPI0018AFC51D|nr:MaoC family dehydratase [Pelagibacterium limicola]
MIDAPIPLLSVETPQSLAVHAGTSLGQSRWVAIDQSMINGFAALSGDNHWIHVDIDRAAQEMPGGKTIAHGLLLLSLIPGLLQEIYRIERRGMGLNYGYDRVRFISQVPVGSRVRLDLALIAAETHQLGTRILTDATLELEGSDKPALIARNIVLVKDPEK